jgi:hypothetical protein
MTSTIPLAASKNGFQVSNVILLGMLAESFVFYTPQTNAGKAFVHSSKMETNENGSLKRMKMANVIQSKFLSFNF